MEMGDSLAMTEEQEDWVFWPVGYHPVAGTERCTCGHAGLGPDWHMRDCPAVLGAWKARAKVLHEQVWELLAEVSTLDAEHTEALDILRDLVAGADDSRCWSIPTEIAGRVRAMVERSGGTGG